MDRRKFVPSTEGLEGRALLSTTSGRSNVFSNTGLSLKPVDTTPTTLVEKFKRIENLPFYLGRFEKGRVMPRETLIKIQNDLRPLVAQLHSPPRSVKEEFNKQLRVIVPHGSISIANAQRLNQAFGHVLSAAGAPPEAVANLKNDLNELAQADSNDKEPVTLVANDYSTILQVALGIGKPVVVTPAKPVKRPHPKLVHNVAHPVGPRG